MPNHNVTIRAAFRPIALYKLPPPEALVPEFENDWYAVDYSGNRVFLFPPNCVTVCLAPVLYPTLGESCRF